MTSSAITAAASRVLLAAAALLMPALAAHAATLAVDRSVLPVEYSVTSPLLVSVTITSDTAFTTGCGLEETIPQGWTYGGYISGAEPTVQPPTGTNGNNGLLEFAWLPQDIGNPPGASFSFSYQLNTAADSIGTREITGRAIAFLNGQEITSPPEETRVPRQGSGTPHDADWNDDFILSLSELLRILQFFAMGGYRCAPVNIDCSMPQSGCLPDRLFAGTVGGNMNCGPISPDWSNGGDYAISLDELLALIQIYNAGTYHSCEGDPDDGFCAGPSE